MRVIAPRSMRRNKSRPTRRSRHRKCLAHALHLPPRRQSEQPLELPVELRSALIPCRVTGSRSGHALAHHQQTCLMQTRGLQVLHGRSARYSFEMAVKGRRTHAGLICKLRHSQRLRICRVQVLQCLADAAEVALLRISCWAAMRCSWCVQNCVRWERSWIRMGTDRRVQRVRAAGRYSIRWARGEGTSQQRNPGRVVRAGCGCCYESLSRVKALHLAEMHRVRLGTLSVDWRESCL